MDYQIVSQKQQLSWLPADFANELELKLSGVMETFRDKFSVHLAGGCRAIIEMAFSPESHPGGERLELDQKLLRMNAFPTVLRIELMTGEHGTFAEVKMDMLKTFSELKATGLAIQDFVQLAKQKASLIIRLCKTDLKIGMVEPYLMSNSPWMDRGQHVWSRDCLWVTNLPGAFRVPFEYCQEGKVVKKAEMRYAASGFEKGEQDLLLAVALWKQTYSIMERAAAKDDKLVFYEADLRKEFPDIEYACRILECGNVLHSLTT